MEFPTDLQSILNRVDDIDPVRYASTRNYLDGAVTYLSPYIARGVISTRWLVSRLIKNGFSVHMMQKLLQELCWRDYFQRVQQHLPLLHLQSIRQEQSDVIDHRISEGIVNAKTSINVIDHGIESLYRTGYMHNHLRMYTAMLACNIASTHWRIPAQWMYYHLLDADVASNFCSWQWVAGAFSSKKYYANQENIDRYSHSVQENTFLSVGYEAFPFTEVPDSLQRRTDHQLVTVLPTHSALKLDGALPVRIYTPYNLDPLWRNAEPANSVLLLEPSHFRAFPVGQKTIDFILALSRNISGIQVFVRELTELKQLTGNAEIQFKEHPLFRHFIGTCDERDWIFPELDRFYPSFFGFWKKAERWMADEKWISDLMEEGKSFSTDKDYYAL